MIKAFIFFVALVASGLAYSFYAEARMQDFCESVPQDATPQSAMDSAKASGLIALGDAGPDHSVVVVNHLMPYFRFRCELSFKASKVTSRSVTSAD